MSQYVSSARAVEILREATQRPNVSRSTLKWLADKGLLEARPVHARCKVYDPDQVRAVAAQLAEADQL